MKKGKQAREVANANQLFKQYEHTIDVTKITELNQPALRSPSQTLVVQSPLDRSPTISGMVVLTKAAATHSMYGKACSIADQENIADDDQPIQKANPP